MSSKWQNDATTLKTTGRVITENILITCFLCIGTNLCGKGSNRRKIGEKRDEEKNPGKPSEVHFDRPDQSRRYQKSPGQGSEVHFDRPEPEQKN